MPHITLTEGQLLSTVFVFDFFYVNKLIFQMIKVIIEC